MRKNSLIIIIMLMLSIQLCNAIPKEFAVNKMPTSLGQNQFNHKTLNNNTFFVENATTLADVTIEQLCKSNLVNDKAAGTASSLTLWNATNTFYGAADGNAGKKFADGSLTKTWSNAPGSNYEQSGTYAAHNDVHIISDAGSSAYSVTYSSLNPSNSFSQWEFQLMIYFGTAGASGLLNINLADSDERFCLCIRGSAAPLTLSAYDGSFYDLTTLQNGVWYSILITQSTSNDFSVFVNQDYIGTYETVDAKDVFATDITFGSYTTPSITCIIDAVDCSLRPNYFPFRSLYREISHTFTNLYAGTYYYQSNVVMEDGAEYYTLPEMLTIAVAPQSNNTQLISESLHATAWEVKDVALKEDLSLGWNISSPNYYDETKNCVEDTGITGTGIIGQTNPTYHFYDIKNTSLAYYRPFLRFAEMLHTDHVISTNLTIYYDGASWATYPLSVSYLNREINSIAELVAGDFFNIGDLIGTFPVQTEPEWQTVNLTEPCPVIVLYLNGSAGSSQYRYFEIEYGATAVMRSTTMKYNNSQPISVVTNQVETINLSRLVNLTRNDIVKINMNNSNAIPTKLYVNGTQAKSLTSTGNNLLYWIADKDYSNVPMSIIAELSTSDILQIPSIQIWNATQSVYNATLAPQSDIFVYINPGIRGVLIYESGELVQFNTLVFNSSNNRVIYTTDNLLTVQISLFDASFNGLVFTDYVVSVQYSKRFYLITEILLTNVIYADIDTNINITVRDRQFDTIIYSNTLVVTQFLNIVCDVFNLRIKNNLISQTHITLNSTYSATLLSDDLIELSLPRSNYVLTYESDAIVSSTISINITLTENTAIQLNTTRFTVYFAIYESTGLGLDSSMLRLYLDGERRDFGFNSADGNTAVVVLDYFNQTVFNETIDTSIISEYNIIASIYSLRIRNNMQQMTTLSVNSYVSNLLVGEQIELHLAPASYNITYENDAAIRTIESILINLSNNWALQLNTTRFSVYFAIFDQQGLGVDHESLRFYLDGVRRDFGLNQVDNPTLVTVLDYFNATIVNETISTNNITEFNLYAPIYTLILYHNYTQPMTCKITRSDLAFAIFEIAIESNKPVPYKFLANKAYTIRWYYQNGTLAQTDNILLNDNKKLNFGAYSYDTPQLTVNDVNNQNFDWLLLLVIMFGVTINGILVGAYIKSKTYTRQDDPIMQQVNQRQIHRKQKTWGRTK